MVQSLGEIARVSAVHADAVRQVIEYSLPGDAKLIPSGFSNLLELLNELQIADETKLQSEEAIQFLSSLKVAG